MSRGMVVDFAVHQPDREDGGIPNPHFHVLCPIRPIEQNGKWGLKQRRVYELDEDGNRIRDADGKFVFVNLRSFFADDPIRSFLRTAIDHQLTLLLVDAWDHPKLPEETRLIIDKDLCEI